LRAISGVLGQPGQCGAKRHDSSRRISDSASLFFNSIACVTTKLAATIAKTKIAIPASTGLVYDQALS
jgi:hypothetical protein